MEAVFNYLTIVAPLAVLVVLILGLINLRRKSPQTSQKLMRWRVGLQFLAIIVIMITVYLARH